MKKVLFVGTIAVVCLSSCDLFSKKDKPKIDDSPITVIDSVDITTDTSTTTMVDSLKPN